MKKVKETLFLTIATILLQLSLYGQTDQLYIQSDEQFENRGGKIYLVPETRIWFGTYTNLELAPQLAYHITDRWSIGLGPHYIFYRNNSLYSVNNYSTHIWGIRSFSRFSVIRDASKILPIYLFDELFVHFEYERMSMENQYFNAPLYPAEGRFWGDYIFIGTGINQRIQGNTSFSVLLLWNLNESLNSIYTNPIYRVGFSIYF